VPITLGKQAELSYEITTMTPKLRLMPQTRTAKLKVDSLSLISDEHFILRAFLRNSVNNSIYMVYGIKERASFHFRGT